MAASRLRRWTWRGAVGGAAILLAGTGWGSSAQASVAQGGVYGTGVITDDWGDEGLLSTTVNSYNNVVLLWQHVLWADGFLPSEDLDRIFGPQTRDATIAWQRAHGLDADGVVGPQTFGRADNKLYWAEGSAIRYDGSVHDFGSSVGTDMYRDSSGRWYVGARAGSVDFSFS